MWDGPQDVFLKFEFRVVTPQISELRGVKNRPFPFTRHIAYITACIATAQAVTRHERLHVSWFSCGASWLFLYGELLIHVGRVGVGAK